MTKWLQGITKDNLLSDSQSQPFGYYNATSTTQGMQGEISLQTTTLGVNFITVNLDLFGPQRMYAEGSMHLMFF